MDKQAATGWTDEAGKLRYMEALGMTVPKATGARPAKPDGASPEPVPAEAVGQTMASISSL